MTTLRISEDSHHQITYDKMLSMFNVDNSTNATTQVYKETLQ